MVKITEIWKEDINLGGIVHINKYEKEYSVIFGKSDKILVLSEKDRTKLILSLGGSIN